MAVITRGIELYHDKVGNTLELEYTNSTYVDGKGVLVPGLQEVSELYAGSASSERDKIEVTTLADDEHVFVDGIQAEGSNDSLTFKLLYEPSLFGGFQAVIAQEQNLAAVAGNGYADKCSKYRVRIPNGTGYSEFVIYGTSSIKLDSAAVNSAMTMTLTVTPSIEADIAFTAKITA